MKYKVGYWYKPFEAFEHHYYLILPNNKAILLIRSSNFTSHINVGEFQGDIWSQGNYLNYMSRAEKQPKNFLPPLTRSQSRFIIRKIF